MGANRRFGLVLVIVCGLIYGYGYWHGTPGTAWLIAALVFAAITLAVPRILQPLLGVWMKIGGLLHVIVSPVLLVLFYFGAVLPIGLVLRLSGKDLLRRRNDFALLHQRGRAVVIEGGDAEDVHPSIPPTPRRPMRVLERLNRPPSWFSAQVPAAAVRSNRSCRCA